MKRIICMVLVFALIAAPSALAEGHRELENDPISIPQEGKRASMKSIQIHP